MRGVVPVCFLTVFAFLLAGCSGTRHLPKGEKLYTGAKIKLVHDKDVAVSPSLKSELKSVVTPKPNSAIFGFLRPKLWLYEVTDTPKGKGLRYFIKKKLGEPPVLASKVSTVKTTALLKNRLVNDGYFQSTIEYKMHEKKRKTSIEYVVTIFNPYTLNKISFPADSGLLDSKIAESKKETLLNEGDIYNLDKLKAERDRIDDYLKKQGYFYFNSDYLVFHADTAVGTHKINLRLEVKDDAPDKALTQYYIHTITVNPDYSLDADTINRPKTDTVFINGVYYLKENDLLSPDVITKAVFFKTDSLYNRKKHDATLHRLMGQGIFKYVSIKFEDIDIHDTSFLNVIIYLTPLKKKSIRAEVLGITKSTNFAGPGVDLSYRDRNLFRGSELLVLSAQGGFETQIAGREYNQPFLGSFTLSGSAKLYFPRMLLPSFLDFTSKNNYVPKTKIELGAEQVYHLQYFTLNTVTFNYGYIWKKSATIEQEFDPFVVNYTDVTNTTPKFDSLLAENILIKNNFEKQFIVGLLYSFTFNNQTVKKFGDQFYFKGTIDLSGNLLSLVNITATGRGEDPNHPDKLFGSPYAQYSRFDIDGRYFHVFRKGNKIATRLIAGIGFPYGNSNELPYIKQFFIGGSNSIRAFRYNTLGPGTLKPPSPDSATFLQQAGDIKLEMNAEYRFNLISIVKGAVFMDGGNIWLLRNDPLRPGGQFQFNSFISQMAIGTGAGLRIDASILVVRVDLAFPLRDPWLAPGERWVFNKIDFGSSGWRNQNLVLNIAIGYPF